MRYDGLCEAKCNLILWTGKWWQIDTMTSAQTTNQWFNYFKCLFFHSNYLTTFFNCSKKQKTNKKRWKTKLTRKRLTPQGSLLSVSSRCYLQFALDFLQFNLRRMKYNKQEDHTCLMELRVFSFHCVLLSSRVQCT